MDGWMNGSHLPIAQGRDIKVFEGGEREVLVRDEMMVFRLGSEMVGTFLCWDRMEDKSIAQGTKKRPDSQPQSIMRGEMHTYPTTTTDISTHPYSIHPSILPSHLQPITANPAVAATQKAPTSQHQTRIAQSRTSACKKRIRIRDFQTLVLEV